MTTSFLSDIFFFISALSAFEMKLEAMLSGEPKSASMSSLVAFALSQIRATVIEEHNKAECAVRQGIEIVL